MYVGFGFQEAVFEKLNPDFKKVLGSTMIRLRNVVWSHRDLKEGANILDPDSDSDADSDSETTREDFYEPAFENFIAVLDAKIVNLAGK